MKANSKTVRHSNASQRIRHDGRGTRARPRALPDLLHAAAQEKFDRGLAMVHSFVYPDSVQAFTEAAAADPQCAIAYWGIAISHRPNPLILPLAAAVLKNGLEAVEKGKAIGAKTERERDWLATIELYYKDYDKVDQTTRGLAYEKAMERLMQKYPDDPEAPSSMRWR